MCAPTAFAFLRGTRGFSVRFAFGILFFRGQGVRGTRKTQVGETMGPQTAAPFCLSF